MTDLCFIIFNIYFMFTSGCTMPAVQLVNCPSECVDDALEGLLACHPSVARLSGHRVVVRRDLSRWLTGCARPHRFAVVCGGGSGHEPAHAGLVGPGLLTAAVAGDVFASPPVSAVLAALRAAAAPAGVLLLVMNYTGDRLNFIALRKTPIFVQFRLFRAFRRRFPLDREADRGRNRASPWHIAPSGCLRSPKLRWPWQVWF